MEDTRAGGEPGPGLAAQESLLTPAEECALYPPGMVPDPQAMVRFLTGVDNTGRWHAIHRGDAADGPPGSGQHAAAVCGQAARGTRYGVYDRVTPPVAHSPCYVCAWHVAIATGSVERELHHITPGRRTSSVLARHGIDPSLATRVCREILARSAAPDAACEPGHPAVVAQLACATAHRPGIALPEDCAEDDTACIHRPASHELDDHTWRCAYPDAPAVCWECSLTTGAWAGEWEGALMHECTVAAPCGPLRALAAHYTVRMPGGRRAAAAP